MVEFIHRIRLQARCLTTRVQPLFKPYFDTRLLVKNVTVLCFFDFHESKESLSLTQNLDTDCLVMGLDAQSKSQPSAVNHLLEKNNPRPGFFFMYLIT
ncbi:putative inactive poly [ADP-ribose] polymerase SRO3 [Gossypium australe]|uniref:Putative inactive poly [ADP-ribose] polymerase SRO3 n=1 Tax=Gossypium australe TaxID=47621 RepID=A0A5B6UA04_9ROSI|nr:putative inactive poly [ADP-ribose] polymerase SRO3 [Gossypium australe]